MGSPYSSPFQLWRQKTGRVQPDVSDTEAMYWGRELEDKVARRYCEVTGRKVRRMPHVASKVHPFMIGNIDRQIVSDGRGPGVLEVKTSGWNDVTGEGELPDHYFAQFQHYLAVTGYSWGSFAFLVNGQRFRTFDLEADRRYQETLIDVERRFWEYVQTDTPPPVEANDCDMLVSMYPKDDGSVVTIDDPEFAALVAEFHLARAEKRDIEAKEKAFKAVIQARIGTAQAIELPGFGMVTYKSTAPVLKEVVDTEALKADGLWDKYSRTDSIPGHRRLLVKPMKAHA
jgi:putative phage-type endonuclease